MKKIFLSILSLVIAMIMFAQSDAVRQIRLFYDGKVIFSRDVTMVDSMNFAWKEIIDNDDVTSGEIDPSKQLYVGVVAFNKDVRQLAITSDMEAVKTYINELNNDKDFTAFAYSVSKGNLQFEATDLPEFDNTFMLNFSDGTDNYSNMKWGEEGRMVSPNLVYDTARYDLMQNTGLNSYAIGFGDDVGFREKMKKVIIGNGGYYNAKSANDLQPTFNEIAKSMLASAKNVLLKTNPGYYSGYYKYFRFSFTSVGGYTDVLYAQMEGTPSTGYTLSISNTENGYASFDTPTKGIVDDESGKVHIPLNNLKFVKDGKELQYKYTIEVSLDGQLYYEDVEEASTAEDISKHIAVVLVLDCSTSMGDAFEPMKAAAIEFVETMEKMEIDNSEPNIPEVPEGAITCAQALEICQATGETATAEEYTIQGYVTEIMTAWNEQYGNIAFWMADATDGGQVLLAFRAKPVNAEEKNVKVGDFVQIVGTLVNYMGNTPEVNAGGQYTILVAGETPDTPIEPEEPEIPDTPVVDSLDGYTKVTNAANLVEGDKVVLYCDASQVGITGWDGNKTATAAASGWVQYVVELTDGGFLLKDGDQYIALTVKNTFSYNATGSVCQVTADGILYIHLESEGKDFLLYENLNNGNTIYRMYVDKAGNKQYNPVYVYKLGEGGETPDTPVDPEQPETPDTPDTPTEPELPEVPEGAITCAQALEICQATGETATAEEYTIQGYVTEIKEAWNDQYSNITFWLADATDGGQVLLAYRAKPVNAEEKNVKVGDFVQIVGTLVNYMGKTPEVNAGCQYTILVAGETPDTPIEPEQPSVETVGDGTEANPFTIEDVIALNNTLSGKHYVKAYIVGQAVGQSFVDGLDMEAPFEAAAEATQGTNLAVASTLNPAVENIIPLQLPKGEWRDAFNLVENPDKLGIQVIICGSLEKYFGLTGIKNVTSIAVIE